MMNLLWQPSTGIMRENVINVWNTVVQYNGRLSMVLWNFHSTCLIFVRAIEFYKGLLQVHVTTAEWLMESFIHKCLQWTGKTASTLNLLSNVITGDKSWIYEYEHESSDHLGGRAQVKSNIKSLCICFFGTDGITHKEFILPDQVITGELCCSKTAKRDK